jgi:Tfp pilus assembly protein PilO
MTARRIDQIWLIGGLALTVLLSVGGWFLLIKPTYAARDTVQSDIDETAANLTTERKRLAELKAELVKIDEYKDTLATAQEAIPYSTTTRQIPEFLRELQTLGSKYHVEVSGYGAASPEASETSAAVTALPTTLIIEGDVDNITRFLKHLQTVQPRAVLIQNASLSAGTEGWELALSLKAFITATETRSTTS